MAKNFAAEPGAIAFDRDSPIAPGRKLLEGLGLGDRETDDNQFHPEGLRTVITAAPGLTPSSVLRRNQKLVFPAVVNTLEVTETATFGDYDSVGAGSFSVRRAGNEKARELKEFRLEVYASNTAWPFLQDGSPVSWERMRTRLDALLHARFPLHLHAQDRVSDAADLNLTVTFRSLSRRSEPGQADSRYFALDIREYRKIKEGEKAVRYERMSGKHHLPIPHYVIRGDETMGDLAVRFYGQFTLYRVIQKANRKLAHVPANVPLRHHAKSIRIPSLPPQNV